MTSLRRGWHATDFLDSIYSKTVVSGGKFYSTFFIQFFTQIRSLPIIFYIDYRGHVCNVGGGTRLEEVRNVFERRIYSISRFYALRIRKSRDGILNDSKWPFSFQRPCNSHVHSIGKCRNGVRASVTKSR